MIPRNSQIYVTMVTVSARATSKRTVSKVEEEQESNENNEDKEEENNDNNEVGEEDVKAENKDEDDEDDDDDDSDEDSDDDLFAQMDKVIQDPDKQARLQQAEDLLSAKNNSACPPVGGNRRGNGPMRPVPDNYICKRCNAKGLHWFNDCPSFLDPHFVEPTHKYLAEVKGVPKIALQKLSKSLDDTDVNNNILVKGEDGQHYEVKLDDSEFNRRVGTNKADEIKEPDHFKCPICSKRMTLPSQMESCCKKSACDKCLQRALLSESTCPLCSTKNVTSDDLVPNRKLRKEIEDFLAAKRRAASGNAKMKVILGFTAPRKMLLVRRRRMHKLTCNSNVVTTKGHGVGTSETVQVATTTNGSSTEAATVTTAAAATSPRDMKQLNTNMIGQLAKRGVNMMMIQQILACGITGNQLSIGLARKTPAEIMQFAAQNRMRVEQKKQSQAVKKKEEVVAHDDDGEYSNDDEDNDQGENGNMDEDDDGEYSDVEYTEDVETVQQRVQQQFRQQQQYRHMQTQQQQQQQNQAKPAAKSWRDLAKKYVGKPQDEEVVEKVEKIEKKSSSPSRRDRSRDRRSGDGGSRDRRK